MEIDKGLLINATTGMMSKLTRLNLDQDALVDSAREALVEKARDIIRQTSVKNNQFQFTAQDEKLFLKSLEENNFDHFYVKSIELNKDLEKIKDKITETISELYQECLSLNIIVTDNPLMKNNACALPNGTVLIDIAMLKIMEYMEELYFILAHECAHVLKQHSIVFNNIDSLSEKFLSGIFSRMRLKNTFFRFLANSSVTIALNRLKNKKIYKLLRHSDEYEADKVAVRVLYALGMSPVVGCKILKTIDPENQTSESHPITSDRIARIDQATKKDRFRKEELSVVQAISPTFKQNVNTAMGQIQKKRKFIKYVSWAFGGITCAAGIILIYFISTMPFFSSESEIVNGFFFMILQLLLRATYFLPPVIFYLVYEKTYQLLK